MIAFGSWALFPRKGAERLLRVSTLDFAVGTFTAKARLANGQEIEVLVDTGATFTKLPRSLLESLGVPPAFVREFEIADGTTVHRPVGYLEIEVAGRKAPVPVAFAENGERPLLGATALEILGFSVDPQKRRLVPAPALDV